MSQIRVGGIRVLSSERYNAKQLRIASKRVVLAAVELDEVIVHLRGRRQKRCELEKKS
jgi:hypothetical protein